MTDLDEGYHERLASEAAAYDSPFSQREQADPSPFADYVLIVRDVGEMAAARLLQARHENNDRGPITREEMMEHLASSRDTILEPTPAVLDFYNGDELAVAHSLGVIASTTRVLL